MNPLYTIRPDPEAPPDPRDVPRPDPSAALEPYLRSLSEEADTPGNGEFVPPTPRAQQDTLRLLSSVSRAHALPGQGDLYGTLDGGVRVEWRNGDRQVRLFIHATDPREDYLYWEQDGAGAGGQHAVATPPTGEALAGWLRWLHGSRK